MPHKYRQKSIENKEATKRGADSDLALPLRHRIRQQAIEPNGQTWQYH
jgi:hypothetical protein